ncbi:hypothetical protein N9A28_09370 [Sulfurimonas sp.]|nr:hypothetical protein [Sulfurimonas sp.]
MNISRQNIYLLGLSVFLLIFVLIFSFGVLIPNGKDYRVKRKELQDEQKKLRQLQNFSDDTSNVLQRLQTDNRHIITAFENSFSVERFEKLHSKFFSTLKLSKIEKSENENIFSVYEVNTTSAISSPKSFYNFLEAVNKSDWIVGINFPINFKRDSETISSSFTMKVYANAQTPQDLNTTK